MMKPEIPLRFQSRRFSCIALSLLILVFAALLTIAHAAGSAWMTKVPAKDHARTNPYGAQSDAVAAGRRLFLEHCAQCHGHDAEGSGKRPSLRSDLIQSGVTEGDLHWLLVNGNMKKGMPSWAKLPDPQLWQLISYIKSLHD